jgi:hypothetical protein
MEEAMQVLTIIELLRLTKIELSNLAAQVANDTPTFTPGSRALCNALTSLRNIRHVLPRRDFSP